MILEKVTKNKNTKDLFLPTVLFPVLFRNDWDFGYQNVFDARMIHLYVIIYAEG